MLGKRDQPPYGRLVQVRHVERDVKRHPRVEGRDAGNFGDPRRQRIGGPLEMGKDVRKAVTLVVSVLGQRQRIERTQRHHEQRHAGGHDQANGQHLPFHTPNVAQEFAVQRAHRATTPSRVEPGDADCV